ncbi:BTAD domain-containing putative transcriptional regulator [Actinacidiphila oryziradicis]|uniref:AfsR/SARP family transcriptional regulator n=1 Tax=Actinacidiphila oryziradicis TaxID=2571141 RepID=UPI0023F40DEC|nr:BTAD domain-containing putative transcriptional regulator [Actinacidiphila oryziradicis]
MRYGILGTTTAYRDDGTVVPLAGVRLRALLAALALSPGRGRSVGALIDDVWDGDPPADGPAALQALVGRLRRAVGHAAVGSVDGGYRLIAGPDAVDAYRFQRLVEEGGRALADGDTAKAAEALDTALELWRGPVVADLPGRTAVAPRYEALRLDARRLRAGVEVALGRAEQILPELAELAAAHPVNEPVQALRIRALREAGRTADALMAYEEVRRELADRLGADPGPELKALHAELLNPRREPQNEPPSRPQGEPPHQQPRRPPQAAAAPGNRRPRLTSFVGRETDLDMIRTDLAAARLVTVTGPGGTGKTRLSQEVGDLVAGQWPDGVWFAELAPVEDARTVPEAVLTALGLRETLLHSGTAAEQALAAESRPKDPGRQLAEYCAGRELLLVLDNCEHVVGAAAALAEQLLRHCPGVAVLATSREPLGVPGELVRPLDPLPQPPALRLLADRGAAARPGFTPADDPEAAAEICRRLDGLPLAIELAAARLRGLTPRQLADRLDDRFRILTGGSRTVLPRQQTLRAVVDWSWELLTVPERVVLRRLAVFAGGWDLSAAEAVCGDPDASGGAETVDPRDIVAALASLVDKSLVLTDLTDDGARYRMLETIGEYAAERLDEAGDRPAVERRHITYFREYIRTVDPKLRGPEQLVWLDRLEREHDNLRAAIRRAVEAGDEQEALVLTLAAGWFWEMRNYRTEMNAWPAAVMAMGPDPFAVPPAHVPLDRGPLDAPPPMPPEQLEEARRWIRIADVTARMEDQDVWADPAARKLGPAIVAAYPPHLPQSSTRPGLMRMVGGLLAGDFDGLAELLDETVESCRRHGRVWELAYALQFRAKVLNDVTDRLDSSMMDVREARELFARVGDDWGLAEALSAEAEAAANGGEWARAADCSRQAIALAGKLGAHQHVPMLMVRLGDALYNAGDPAEGERLIRAGIQDAERFGVVAGGAAYYGRVLLTTVLGRRGDLDEAHTLVDGMRNQLPTGMPSFVAGLLDALKGWLLGLGGDPEGGLRLHRGTIVHLDDHPMTSVIIPRVGIMLIPPAVTLLERLARPEADRRAALLIGAHDRLRPTAVGPLEKQSLDESAAVLRERLGPAAYNALYAEGERLGLEETVALMREAP